MFLRERNLLGRPGATAPVASPPYSGPDHIPSSKFFISKSLSTALPVCGQRSQKQHFCVRFLGLFCIYSTSYIYLSYYEKAIKAL